MRVVVVLVAMLAAKAHLEPLRAFPFPFAREEAEQRVVLWVSVLDQLWGDVHEGGVN